MNLEQNIYPAKIVEGMDHFTKMRLSVMNHGGIFNKLTLNIYIYGVHDNIRDVCCTVNHEFLHLLVQEFIGEPDGWEASTALDLPQFDDFMCLWGNEQRRLFGNHDNWEVS